MTIRLVDRPWLNEFTEALKDDASELRIICPFIKEKALQRLLDHHPKNIQVITRFNLGDFADRVSDVAALRKLLEADAKVRGIRNLHAKLYLFGKKRAILTSCNLTEAALTRNHEFGMVTSDGTTIEKCLEYFENLWNFADNDLTLDRVNDWDKTVTEYRLGGGRPHARVGLGDFGVDNGIIETPPAQGPIGVSASSQGIGEVPRIKQQSLPAVGLDHRRDQEGWMPLVNLLSHQQAAKNSARWCNNLFGASYSKSK